MLSKLIAKGRPLLADGATGTNLFAAGLDSGECAEFGTRPSRSYPRLHQNFVDAGADIILTNSFGGNRRRLGMHGSARGRRRSTYSRRKMRAPSPIGGPPRRRGGFGRSDR